MLNVWCKITSDAKIKLLSFYQRGASKQQKGVPAISENPNTSLRTNTSKEGEICDSVRLRQKKRNKKTYTDGQTWMITSNS